MREMNSLCFQSFLSVPPLRSNGLRFTCSRRTCRISMTSAGAIVAPDEWDIRLCSPSKINLFLRVMGKRSDGYHELASLFQAISLHDVLYVSKNDDSEAEDSLECDLPGLPVDKSNLVLKAFDKFRERTGVTTRFRARLEKRIPHAAGLGGGSGNAATALWAANKLTGGHCSDKDLAAFGAEFGSDISFFFSNGSAYCTGRGEVFEEIPRLRPQTLYIVKPREGLSTKEVFDNLDLTTCAKENPRVLMEKMQKGVIFADFINDLEASSFKLLPRLADLKKALYESGFNVVLMSGSGTSFFCLGHPSKQTFLENFPAQHDVKIMQAMFACRRFEGLWYFEQPPLEAEKRDDYTKLLQSL